MLFERLSKNLWGSDALPFPEFIDIVSIMFYNLYWTYYIVIYSFNNSFCSVQRKYDFSDFIY